MLHWFKKSRYRPSRPEDNPGLGSSASVASSGLASRTETLDLLGLLSSTLTKHSIGHRIRDGWLTLPHGIMLLPEFVSLEPRSDGGAKTTTTISVCHQAQIPSGLFEYQHSVSDTAINSITKGFDLWIRLDLKTLMEAVKDGEADCMSMVMDFPGTTEAKPFRRRVVLGPTVHHVTEHDQRVEDEHPFCPCCLFTNSFNAFNTQLEGEGFFGLRLFASRDAEGVIEADCRVNGIDWPAGANELVRYVEKWPQRGLEFRKQFVVIQPFASARQRP